MTKITSVLRAFVQNVFSSDSFRGRGYHRPSAVERLFQAHLDKKTHSGQTLWKILNLELWFKTFIDGDGPIHTPDPQRVNSSRGATLRPEQN
jgi:hypothetical protein